MAFNGNALKKDNVVKHSKSDMHKKAISLERQPTRTINEILRSMPIGRAVVSASSEEKDRVSRLFKGSANDEKKTAYQFWDQLFMQRQKSC